MLFTPIDSLDTLLLMGLHDEYQQAKELVLDMNLDNCKNTVNVFETTIRTLGGLLSAYELEGDDRFIEKAVQVADILLLAFNTPTGIPLNYIHLEDGGKATGIGQDKTTAVLADAGTMQLEFQYLSDITGNPIYAQKALYAFDQIIAIPQQIKGLYPSKINVERLGSGFGNYYYGMGAGCDSFYEYILKLWLATGLEKYWKQFADSREVIFIVAYLFFYLNLFLFYHFM